MHSMVHEVDAGYKRYMVGNSTRRKIETIERHITRIRDDLRDRKRAISIVSEFFLESVLRRGMYEYL